MYQWRKFEFFEEKSGGKSSIPAEVTGRINCCSGGRGRIVVGCDDGTVSLLDRGFKLIYGFHAHASSVLFLQQLKQRNYLVTVGEEEHTSFHLSSICLKVFDLDKMQPEGSSTTAPLCVQILRIFTNQFPEAKITSFLVLEEAPPILLISIGLDTGSIYCIKGDLTRERITRFKLQVEGQIETSDSSITGLGYRVEGQALQLFAITPTSVSSFSLHDNPPRRQTLDQIGCGSNAVTMSDRLDLIIGRPEAVYFYEVDGRGPCWAFDGEKKLLGWFRGYLLCVIGEQRSGKNSFNIYDLKNRLIAHSILVDEISHMLCEWGYIILIMSDRKVLFIGERDMESKLDMLFKKNLYNVAINLVHSQQADAAATAQVLRKYGDHLYGKQEYDEAMSQYIQTIGHLEPSYVIQKFLDAQRIYNLTNYLEQLHDRGLASKDHTTLLLNCYTKLKDVEKLNRFIKGEDGVSEQRFDVETAIRVCRSAGYHEHAMYVAKKAARHEWYLKILLEDLGAYEEALQYISYLEPNQAGVTLKEYGHILIQHRPAETIGILMHICGGGAQLSMLPSPMDFINIFVHCPQSLVDFLEKYVSQVKESPSQFEINNTLLELYLSNISSSFPSRFEKGLSLLKSEWTAEMEQPAYDVDLSIILCEMNSFKEGLLFLYEKMKLYKQVIACYMQAHDHQGLIGCCKKLGDPSLWGDVLKYFGELGEDCSEQVKEVLSYIERDDIFPPIVVLQALSKNPCLTVSVVRDYVARKLEQESKLIEDDRKAIDKYEEGTNSMRKEIEEMRSNAKIFQLSKCSACTFTLDLPAVHFMCMHSFHLRCLGDNEKECPECAPEYRTVLDAKKNVERNAKDMQERFFDRVKTSKDGFSVIAEYFSKGFLSKTTTGDDITG